MRSKPIKTRKKTKQTKNRKKLIADEQKIYDSVKIDEQKIYDSVETTQNQVNQPFKNRPNSLGKNEVSKRKKKQKKIFTMLKLKFTNNRGKSKQCEFSNSRGKSEH